MKSLLSGGIDLTFLQVTRAETATKRELYLWLIGAVVVVLAAKVFSFGSLALFEVALEKINYFMWAAVGVAIWRLTEFSSNQPIQFRDQFLMVGVFIGLIVASMTTAVVGFGLVFGLFGIMLISTSPKDENLNAAGIVMLALMTHFTLAPLFFRMFLDQILTADTAIVALAFHFLRPDLVWTSSTQITNPSSHFGIILVGGCSAFGHLSAALLVHLTWAMKYRTYLSRYDVVAVSATAIVIIIVNTARLVLTGWDMSGFQFWHGSGSLRFGATIFVILQTSIIVISGYISATWVATREA